MYLFNPFTLCLAFSLLLSCNASAIHQPSGARRHSLSSRMAQRATSSSDVCRTPQRQLIADSDLSRSNGNLREGDVREMSNLRDRPGSDTFVDRIPSSAPFLTQDNNDPTSAKDENAPVTEKDAPCTSPEPIANPGPEFDCRAPCSHSGACWDRLEIEKWINDKWDPSTNCGNMAFADCFLATYKQSKFQCSTMNQGSCTPEVATTEYGMEAYYVLFTIYSVHNFFNQWYEAAHKAYQEVVENIEDLVKVFNPVRKTEEDDKEKKGLFIFFQIIETLIMGLLMFIPGLGPALDVGMMAGKVLGTGIAKAAKGGSPTLIQNAGESVPRLGIPLPPGRAPDPPAVSAPKLPVAPLIAFGAAGGAGAAGTGTVYGSLFPQATEDSQDIQVDALKDAMDKVDKELKERINNALQAVQHNITNFVEFARGGAFSNGNVTNVHDLQKKMTIALNTYLVSRVMAGNNIAAVVAPNKDVVAFERDSLKPENPDLVYPLGCLDGYNEHGVCKHWWYSANDHSTYTLDSFSHMACTMSDFARELDTIFSKGYTTGELLFESAAKCNRQYEGEDEIPVVGVKNGQPFLGCVSQLKVLTLDYDCDQDGKKPFAECEFLERKPQDGWGEFTDINPYVEKGKPGWRNAIRKVVGVFKGYLGTCLEKGKCKSLVSNTNLTSYEYQMERWEKGECNFENVYNATTWDR
ncbi:MAG: hypothetical protein M1837_001124 [Sclerophora amabilis]|nr:MAG: hypothetical protein M1837_001124 [Sclerophora amabilis]